MMAILRQGFVLRQRIAQAIYRLALLTGAMLASFTNIELRAEEAKLAVTPIHASHGAFSGVASEYVFEVDFPEKTTSIGWSLSVAQRTLSRGELSAKPVRGDAAGRIRLPLQFPATKPGVSVAVKLSFQALDAAGSSLGGWQMPVVIFPEDPFWERSTWLKNLNITLFDPAGKTIELFEEASIPFELARSEAAFAEARPGLMIVGEGIAWNAQRNLPATLLTAAAAGRRIVCLAPSEGDFPLPSDDEAADVAFPSELRLHGAGILPQLDKRFASEWLAGQRQSIARCTPVAGLGNGAALRFGTEGERGWAWVDFHFASAKGEGRLVLCGFRVIQSWNDGPEPRYLLASMMEFLSRAEIQQKPSP
jgi:hypothetical protein